MASTSIVTLSWEIRGRPEGGSDQGKYTQRNSTGVDDAIETTATTLATAGASLVPPSNTKFMALIMPSTNKVPVRLSGSTAEAGIPLSSQGGSVVCVTTGTTYFVYTTSSTAVTGIRVLWL